MEMGDGAAVGVGAMVLRMADMLAMVDGLEGSERFLDVLSGTMISQEDVKPL